MYQVYACEHCNTFMGKSKDVLQHQFECLYNPRMKSCFSCKNYKQASGYNEHKCLAGHTGFPCTYLEFVNPYPIYCSSYI